MAEVTYVEFNGAKHVVDVAEGENVMRGALYNDLPGIIGECGGGLACATCHCYVDEACHAASCAAICSCACVRYTRTDARDHYSPHNALGQRGSNENANGLIRQYLSKGTELSGHRQIDLNIIAPRFQRLIGLHRC